MKREFHKLKVRDIRPLAEDACRVTFDVPPELAPIFAFRPGQYLTLQRRIDNRRLRRSYSICSPPGAPLSVGIRRIEGGAFSTFATGALAPGDLIEVMPPQGRFGANSGKGQSLLLIAAGSGITPMMPIMEAALGGDASSRVTLVYSNRHSRSIMFHDALETLKDRYLERFTLIHVLSREEQDVPLLNGRIDAAKLTALSRAGAIAPAAADAILLCGPAQMIEITKTALADLGADPARIQNEYFHTGTQPPRPKPAAAPIAAPREGVKVDVTLDGRRHSFTMPPGGESVVEGAEKAGFELPFSCRGGMCCTCRCRIVEGSATMALNYSLEPWEIAAGFTLACQAQPTSGRLVLDFDES